MMNAKRPHFFQGFDPSTSSELLRIPSKFIRNIEGTTSGSAYIAGPSGSIWQVDLIQRNDGLFFANGWATFVRDHFIEGGDLLVFGYDGNLHFTVQVFDQSSCEKEAAFSATCSQDTSLSDKLMGNKRDRETTTFCLGDIFEGVPKKMRGSHSEFPTVDETCQATIFSNETENFPSPLKSNVTLAIPLQSIYLRENSEAAIQNGTSKVDELGPYGTGCMSMMSAPEAEKLARSFTSSFPNFMKIMKRFNVSGSYTLNIPYQFSMEHLPKCKVKIVLHNLKGESWTVNSIPSTRVQTSHTFCGGWMAFVRDNNIEMGDICIFELVHKCEMRVQILGVGKRGADCSIGKAAFKGLNDGCAVTSRQISEGLPKKMRENSRKAHYKLITNVEIADKKGSDRGELLKCKSSHEAAFTTDKVKHTNASKGSARSWSKACSGKRGIQKNTSLDDKLGSHTKVCMSMKSVPEEKRAAQSFVSNFPHFVRIMKKFNVSGSFTLKVPYRFSMAHLPSCKTEIVLRNLRGGSWTVNSVATIKVQTLHTFCGGWMAFVRDNDIQMGDICIFELIGKCEMRVHISGVGKKGLDYQSGKAASNESTLGFSLCS